MWRYLHLSSRLKSTQKKGFATNPLTSRNRWGYSFPHSIRYMDGARTRPSIPHQKGAYRVLRNDRQFSLTRNGTPNRIETVNVPYPEHLTSIHSRERGALSHANTVYGKCSANVHREEMEARGYQTPGSRYLGGPYDRASVISLRESPEKGAAARCNM